MKKLLLLLLPATLFAQTTKRVLFIGNSYTGVNNLPQMLAQVAASAGDSVVYDSNTPGGYTFQMHSTDATTLSKIAQGDWDVVVLQEQSQLPSFSPAQVAGQVYPFAARLDSLVKAANPCTETMFYMTWGRKYGDASNCAGYPPVCTYEGMQLRLRDSYVEMANDNNSSVSPAGMAWKRVRDIDTTIELYQADYSHPSVAGSYLVACTFYSSIFHRASSGIGFTSGLPAPQVSLLQSAADFVVFDSLQQWQEAGNLVSAGFDFAIAANTVSFNNQSLNATTYSWNFGDGNSSPLSNPQHTFATTGSYPVTLMASNTCNSETHTGTVTISAVSALHEATAQRIHLTLTPTQLHVSGMEAGCEIALYNITGQLLWKCVAEQSAQLFQLPPLPVGCYLATVSKEGALLHSQPLLR